MSHFDLFFTDDKVNEAEVIKTAKNCGFWLDGVNKVVDNNKKHVFHSSEGGVGIVAIACRYEDCKTFEDFVEKTKETFHPHMYIIVRESYAGIISFLNDILKQYKSFYILPYIEHGRLDETEIQISEKKEIKLQDFTIETLAFLPYNTLLKITK